MDEKIKKEREDLINAAKPLLKYINENYHPHVTVIITQTSVELLSSEIYHENIIEFLVD